MKITIEIDDNLVNRFQIEQNLPDSELETAREFANAVAEATMDQVFGSFEGCITTKEISNYHILLESED